MKRKKNEFVDTLETELQFRKQKRIKRNEKQVHKTMIIVHKNHKTTHFSYVELNALLESNSNFVPTKKKKRKEESPFDVFLLESNFFGFNSESVFFIDNCLLNC